MHITIWIVQGILALGFVYSGWMKAFRADQAQQSWSWVKDVPRGLVGFIGILELLGAVGLIVPQAAGISPWLTPVAALALAVVVLLGALFHIVRKEYKDIGVNLVFLALAVVVMIGRF
ncbi:DoxX family protein [Paenibacillus ferrarius]|uniref:DoxX family protein n=1 Tax=Paenibacillus ferrarius TaxID=1469647 RepID=UPI003D265DC8